jgi:hypothetical protein
MPVFGCVLDYVHACRAYALCECVFVRARVYSSRPDPIRPQPQPTILHRSNRNNSLSLLHSLSFTPLNPLSREVSPPEFSLHTKV